MLLCGEEVCLQVGARSIKDQGDLSSKTWTRKVGLIVLDRVFEGHRGLETEGAVETHAVVEGFDVVEDQKMMLGIC